MKLLLLYLTEDIIAAVQLHHCKQLLLYPAVACACEPGLTLRKLLFNCAAVLLQCVRKLLGVWYNIHLERFVMWNSIWMYTLYHTWRIHDLQGTSIEHVCSYFALMYCVHQSNQLVVDSLGF